jgi:hypothetical protein
VPGQVVRDDTIAGQQVPEEPPDAQSPGRATGG